MVLQQDICFSCKLNSKLSCRAEDKSKYWRYSLICIALHSIQDWFNCRKLFINPFWINWLNNMNIKRNIISENNIIYHEWTLPEKLHFCRFQFWPWQEHLYLLIYSIISENSMTSVITCSDSSGRDITEWYHKVESPKMKKYLSQATWTICLCLKKISQCTNKDLITWLLERCTCIRLRGATSTSFWHICSQILLNPNTCFPHITKFILFPFFV